jgi:two-component system sensor histidine kinase QseC
MRFASFRLPRSLAVQLLCTYVAALLFMVCSIVGVMWVSSRQDAGVTTQGVLLKVADMIREELQFDAAGVPRRIASFPSDLWWVFRDFPADVKYRIVDRSGRVIISSERGASALTPSGQPFYPAQVSFTLGSGSDVILVTTEPVVHGAQTYFIQVALSKRLIAFVQAVKMRIRTKDTFGLALGSVVLVTIAVYFTLRRVLKPLRETSAAAARIDERNLSKRLSVERVPTEFLPVIEAFNLTLDRLEKGYSVQRAFLADAAHELKTPLALIRAQIDIDGTADRQALLQDIDRMARQVNQLLHLAEASETRNFIFESVDVAAIAEDVTDYLRRLAECREVYVDIRCAPGIALVQADRGALFMLLKNLVENAIQHSPSGSAVLIKIATTHLSVRDEGSGIAKADLPQLFKRFWRGPMRRNEGAGLGLSICAEIAAAHEWGLTAHNMGQGAEFVLYFGTPSAPPREAIHFDNVGGQVGLPEPRYTE